MEYRVDISPRAEADIENAYLFIRERSPQAATRWFNGIYEAMDSLESMPSRCPLAAESEELGFELRQLLYGTRVWRYRIYFVIYEELKLVRVMTVRHGARDRLQREDIEDEL